MATQHIRTNPLKEQLTPEHRIEPSFRLKGQVGKQYVRIIVSPDLFRQQAICGLGRVGYHCRGLQYPYQNEVFAVGETPALPEPHSE